MRNSAETGEKDLVIQLRNGSEEAFSELYKLYKKGIFRYCLLLTKSEEIASEMEQQIFISLWLNHKRLDPENSFASYLFTIAKNKIRNYFRDIARNTEMQSNWIRNNELSEDSAEQTAILNERDTTLTNAIENLPERKKYIFTLGRLEGKSYEEISRALGISKNTVKNHLVEATKQIKQYILANSHITVPAIILFFF